MAVNTPASTEQLTELIPHEGHRRWVMGVARQLPFMADLIPADLLIYVPAPDGRLVAIAEAKPTVRESFYLRTMVGTMLDPASGGPFFAALESGALTAGALGKVVNGQPMSQMIYPLSDGRHRVALLAVERSLYDELKHSEEKRQLYRIAIDRAVLTLIDRSRASEVTMPPMQAGDALLLLNAKGVIQHASPTAVTLARRMGLPETLEGTSWPETVLANREHKVLTTNSVYEELELSSPRMAVLARKMALEPADEAIASLVVLRDVSELKEKDRELAIKETIIREVHHRVKNNLQTIAGLLRLQQRRSRNTEVKRILNDCIDRIASIAMVHEYLSHEDVGVVDLKELAYNLLSASLQSMLPPEKVLDARVVAPASPVSLSSSKATSVALIITELLQNTFKHAFTGRTQGHVELTLALVDDQHVAITLHDDGIGMPKGFDPSKDANLGWEIISTLARQDLRGDLTLESSPSGTTVTVTLPVTE